MCQIMCHVSKETYYSVKRDLLQCQKRPTTVSKETYYSVKRDLLQCQIMCHVIMCHVSKERHLRVFTFSHVKKNSGKKTSRNRRTRVPRKRPHIALRVSTFSSTLSPPPPPPPPPPPRLSTCSQISNTLATQ